MGEDEMTNDDIHITNSASSQVGEGTRLITEDA